MAIPTNADSIETKNATFTPGPWHVYANLVIAGKGRIVAELPSPESRGADIRLIAAAPEMIAALRAVADDAVLIGNGESAISLSTRRLVETLLCRLEG